MRQELLGRVAGGENLTQEEADQLIESVMRGELTDPQVGLLLTALRTKGETSAEIAGAAAALRRHMIPIRSRRSGVLDTCGTGGDGAATFNISTAAALVIAAAGVPVAKHGNRKFTSRSGSADVLAALGVGIEATVETVEACLDELGICFCFAPLLHPAMKRVAEVRQKIGGRTIFNLLGPLTNPANAPFRLLGVGQAASRPLLAEALQKLGVERALVVHGVDGLDEVTTCADTEATVIAAGEPALEEIVWSPADFGIPRADPGTLIVHNAEESAAIIRSVLANQPSPARDITLVNAAAALWIAGQARSVVDGLDRAREALGSGAARDLLERLVRYTTASTSS